MSCLDFNEVELVEDNVTEGDVFKHIIRSENREDSFHVLDLGDIIDRHKTWVRLMPKVVPHFGK